jgi:hypothetical protein
MTRIVRRLRPRFIYPLAPGSSTQRAVNPMNAEIGHARAQNGRKPSRRLRSPVEAAFAGRRKGRRARNSPGLPAFYPDAPAVSAVRTDGPSNAPAHRNLPSRRKPPNLAVTTKRAAGVPIIGHRLKSVGPALPCRPHNNELGGVMQE